MKSMFLVLLLTFVLAVQSFDVTEKDGNRTSTGSEPLPTMITDKQINNAHFSRRGSDLDDETGKPIDRNARHTMIVDSGITNSDFHFRSMDKRGNLDISHTRPSAFFVNTTGSGNRIVQRPERSRNEFIVEGDSDSSPALFIHNGKSVDVMKVGSASNGAAKTPSAQATPNVQSMPTTGSGMTGSGSQSFSASSASGHKAPFTGSVQGGVINGATFTRRSANGQDAAVTPLERQSRDTYIGKSQINDGRFSRRNSKGLGKEDTSLERQSRDTYIGKSQINDGRFSRRSANGLGKEDMPLDRKSRNTFINKSQINDSTFTRRDTPELASEEKVSP